MQAIKTNKNTEVFTRFTQSRDRQRTVEAYLVDTPKKERKSRYLKQIFYDAAQK